MSTPERHPLHTGGCQCGAVRFALFAEPTHASVCHCRMCQKAFAAPYAALANVAKSDLAWTRGAPRLFDSSDVVERGFCSNCGTPLTFGVKGRDSVSLAIVAFDRPERVQPAVAWWASRRIPWQLAGLTEHATDEDEAMPMITAIAASTHQHPDHDTADWHANPSRAWPDDGTRQ